MKNLDVQRSYYNCVSGETKSYLERWEVRRSRRTLRGPSINFNYISTSCVYNSLHMQLLNCHISLKQKFWIWYTVWSEGFLYKVATPDLKISPIMYFVIHNSVVLSKILKIVVPLEQIFKKTDFYSIKLVILIIIDMANRGHNDFQYFG